MTVYMEGIVWYLVLLDAIIYNLWCWFSQRQTHWISPHLPLNRFFGVIYGILMLWMGFALWRLQIITFQ
ncbi:MAG: hypothetical protein AABX37_05705 [Nanoarchaeota archaeon]